mgnify:CR=1 FL=1
MRADTKMMQVAKGMFESNCAACHGERGDRVPNTPLKSAEYLTKLGDGGLIGAIADGKGVMPGFARAKGGVFDVPDVGAQWFVDAVRRELVDRYGEQVVETQGLRVAHVGARRGLEAAAEASVAVALHRLATARGLVGLDLLDALPLAEVRLALLVSTTGKSLAERAGVALAVLGGELVKLLLLALGVERVRGLDAVPEAPLAPAAPEIGRAHV